MNNDLHTNKRLAPHMQAIRILVVEYRTLIRSGISALLDRYPDLEVVGQVQNGHEALGFVQSQPVDVVTVDIDMPGPLGGAELISALRAASPYARILVVTNILETAMIHSTLRAGAVSYLLKNITVEELAQAIRSACQGVPTISPEATHMLFKQTSTPAEIMRSLTAREHQVLGLMSRGWNNHQIALELSISLSTVQFHISNIFAKLDVRNRTEAATFAVRHQLGVNDRV